MPGVRSSAARAVIEIDPASAEVFVALREMTTGDPDDDARATAAQCLSLTVGHEAEATAAILRFLRTPPSERDPIRSLMRSMQGLPGGVVEGLARLGDPGLDALAVLFRGAEKLERWTMPDQVLGDVDLVAPAYGAAGYVFPPGFKMPRSEADEKDEDPEDDTCRPWLEHDGLRPTPPPTPMEPSAILAALASASRAERVRALRATPRLGPRAVPVLPALTALLRAVDREPFDAALALAVLGDLGGTANAVLPVIDGLVDHPMLGMQANLVAGRIRMLQGR